MKSIEQLCDERREHQRICSYCNGTITLNEKFIACDIDDAIDEELMLAEERNYIELTGER